jgi:hypothetical protein
VFHLAARYRHSPKRIKVFCFFFSKKKGLLSEEKKQKTFTYCAGTHHRAGALGKPGRLWLERDDHASFPGFRKTDRRA